MHDLLLAKRGISAPASHPLRVVVEKNKARLSAEFARVRLKKGFASVEELRKFVDNGATWQEQPNGSANSNGHGGVGAQATWHHPRWVRINTIKTTLKEQMKTTFAGYTALDSLEELVGKPPHLEGRFIHIDKHIPDLLAISPKIDLSKTAAYRDGLIIFQDKASCFPAYLLNPLSGTGDIVDACAAPGNKTTHLAAIVHSHNDGQPTKIYACERNGARTQILDQMIQTAGAGDLVKVKGKQDFLKVDPQKSPWNAATALLLDPSCSGSGMVSRNDVFKVVLPSKAAIETSSQTSKKRKRKAPRNVEAIPKVAQEEAPIGDDKTFVELSARLEALSNFQLKLLVHAFSFPAACRITYSTCSIYKEENEHVVMKALESAIAKERGWRVLWRHEQVEGMKAWESRGYLSACNDVAYASYELKRIAEACIRCEKGTKEGTQGFFTVGFVRVPELLADTPLDHWEGFSDDDGADEAEHTVWNDEEGMRKSAYFNRLYGFK